MFLIEYAILGAATAAFAVGAGTLIAWLVVTRIMFADFAFDWTSALAAAGGGLAFTVGPRHGRRMAHSRTKAGGVPARIMIRDGAVAAAGATGRTIGRRGTSGANAMAALTQSYVHAYVHGASSTLLGETIGALLRRLAEEDPQRLALVARHQNVRWTSGDLLRRRPRDRAKSTRPAKGRPDRHLVDQQQRVMRRAMMKELALVEEKTA